MSLINEMLIFLETLSGGHKINLEGHRLVLHPYDRKLWKKLIAGGWEPKTLAWLKENIKPGSVFLDVGAWVGPTTIYAHLCGAKVVAIEPDPLAYERLLYNINKNNFHAISTIHGGLSNTNGRFSIHCGRGLGKSMSQMDFSGTEPKMNVDQNTVSVSGFDLDTILRISETEKVDILKMDIEGGEFYVFPEIASRLVGKVKKIMLSLHGKRLSEIEFHRLSDQLICATELFTLRLDREGNIWEWNAERRNEFRTKYTEIILS